jgi:hypothetical protein
LDVADGAVEGTAKAELRVRGAVVDTVRAEVAVECEGAFESATEAPVMGAGMSVGEFSDKLTEMVAVKIALGVEGTEEIAGEATNTVEVEGADLVEVSDDGATKGGGELAGKATYLFEIQGELDRADELQRASEINVVIEVAACVCDARVSPKCHAVLRAERLEIPLPGRGVLRCGAQSGLSGRGGREDVGKAAFEIEDGIKVVHQSVVTGMKQDFPQAGFSVEDSIEVTQENALVLSQPTGHPLIPFICGGVISHCPSSCATKQARVRRAFLRLARTASGFRSSCSAISEGV